MTDHARRMLVLAAFSTGGEPMPLCRSRTTKTEKVDLSALLLNKSALVDVS